MTIELINYLSSFGDIGNYPRQMLLNELDKVWDQFELDNTKSLQTQLKSVGEFYSHPVWVLNGLFSELDAESKRQRIAIAKCIKNLEASRVADYGGGSGVLAGLISEVSSARIDVIEPYPSLFFMKRIDRYQNVYFEKTFVGEYDVIVAQDVLEHLDDPLQAAMKIISATRVGGHLIFANCFYPVMKSHLPSNFYLRNTFDLAMKFMGLRLLGSVDGVTHAKVFEKVSNCSLAKVRLAKFVASLIGPALNQAYKSATIFKNFLLR